MAKRDPSIEHCVVSNLKLRNTSSLKYHKVTFMRTIKNTTLKTAIFVIFFFYSAETK